MLTVDPIVVHVNNLLLLWVISVLAITSCIVGVCPRGDLEHEQDRSAALRQRTSSLSRPAGLCNLVSVSRGGCFVKVCAPQEV